MAKSLKRQADEAELRLKVAYMSKVQEMMQSLPSFAKDADESKWVSLTAERHEYTEADITSMQESAMALYYTDPSARGIIDTMVNFVVGSDAHMSPVDESELVAEVWKNFCDENGFDMRMKELVRRTFRDGESFLRFFKNKTKGGAPLVRFLEPTKIHDDTGTHSFGIETDPEDVETIIRYHLKDGNSILTEDVIHTKINVDANVKRGISFLVGISKYIVKYGGWIDDRIKLNKIRTMFNMVMKVTGISPADFSDKLDDATNKRTKSGESKKRLPKSGTVLIATPGVEYDFKNLNIDASDTKDDGRLIELQIAKGTNLTEYVVRADSSNSNYSSTMVSESPMVKMFEAWQDIFEKPMKKIFKKVIEIAIANKVLPKETDTDCAVNFAALIHRNLGEETTAYCLQIEERLVSKKTISEKFGYDYDLERIQILKEIEEDKALGLDIDPNAEAEREAEGDDEEDNANDSDE